MVAGNADFPGAPLTSFFDSLSPLQKQLLLQQQFQQVSPNVKTKSPSVSLPQFLQQTPQLMLSAANVWKQVSL